MFINPVAETHEPFTAVLVLGLGDEFGAVITRFVDGFQHFNHGLIGAAMRERPVTEVFDRLQPMALKGFAINVVSGMLLTLSEPVKCYHSPYFIIKMAFLFLLGLNAVAFQYLTYPTVAGWDKAVATPVGAKLAGWVSLAFWLGVVVMGRAIAYATK